MVFLSNVFNSDGSGGLVKIPALAKTIEKPQPIARKTSLVDNLDEYLALATELGTAQAELIPADRTRASIADFLWERGIEIYDKDHAEDYLVRQGRKAHPDHDRWGGSYEVDWKPLRQADVTNVRTEIYKKPVPLEILRNVKLLIDNFKDLQLIFKVSEVKFYPDPFIYVTAPGIKPIVFGVWDEPGYSMEK
jgi:hypothetical protein